MSDFWLDFPNFLVCITLVLMAHLRGVINFNVATVLFASSIVPFLLNDMLFPASYMPDQFRYWEVTKSLRELNFSVWDRTLSINFSSAVLALFPLPFMHTIVSLGFVNKFIYLFSVVGLVRARIASHSILLFLVLYPSLILYTSLSLRDTLVVVFMLLGFLMVIKNKFFLAFLFLSPLLVIKSQNVFIMLIFVSIYIFFGVGRQGLSASRFFFLLVGLGLMMIAIYPLAIDQINFYRIAMFAEDGGDPEKIEVISGFGDFLLNGITGALYFLIKPLPWEAENILQLVQSFENAVVGVFLLWLTKKAWELNREKTLFWILFLLGAFTIYGLVVFNYGTAARYRFPFLVVYVVCMAYDTGLVQHWQNVRKKSLLGQ
ncbi:hypothetical protein FGL86_13850 [Pistricoccus aurantiacus]|uniref:EpsG family protein n=1 Tax=Pistricoccus aurantiacus TaxID=1883414 RepID=A0A5B8SUR7_9GAMM|nr:hypothetical protein [Pistricoccus aurantiacus]QEA40054.1 hypothetical protein FGL86_13850 [Pistricoccus aurantiacus]